MQDSPESGGFCILVCSHDRCSGRLEKPMHFQRELWTRFEAEGIPIYVRGDRPQWFVPTTAGDRGLKDWPSVALDGVLQPRRFMERPPGDLPLHYPGRGQVLKLRHLREFWFHLTNRCNQ